MPKLPALTANDLIKILEKLGFECKRQRGSHFFYEHPDGRTTIVPFHAKETIDTGLLNKIIKHDIKINREDFLDLL